MLFSSLLRQAGKQPEHVAIIDDRGPMTYAQLAAAATALSATIAQQTQKPIVGILLPPGSAFVASFYGTLLAGKSVVPINYLLGDTEIAYVIKDSGVDAIITAPPLAGRVKDSSIRLIDPVPTQAPPASFKEFILPNPQPDDLAVLMYTSGTSGLPKGVMLSYENLQSDVDAAIAAAALLHDHRFLGIIPLFHAFGMTAMMLAPIQLGATIIYLGRFSAVATLNAIRQHNVSLFFGVPSMFAAIAHLKSASADDFKNIYALMSGAEPLPRSLYDTFRERFGVSLMEGYGLTETSPVIALNVPGAHKLGSVGRLIPGARAKIVDDNGQELPAGQTGEIWLAGSMIMRGYFNLPNETAAALTADRFFKTGDLGMIDDEGYLHITGRKKEMISVAGEKASPREIEDALLKNPAVAEAAVLGKKDSARGEVVVAFVILRENDSVTPDVLRAFVRDNGLANWKVPREIFIVDDLPRSPTGKVLKRVLAQQLSAMP